MKYLYRIIDTIRKYTSSHLGFENNFWHNMTSGALNLNVQFRHTL